MYQQSPSLAARRIAASALAPIQMGGIGFCIGLTVELACSSTKCEPVMSTKSSVHSRLTAIKHSSKRAGRLLTGQAESLEFDVAVADAATKDELAAAHDVQRRELLGMCNGNSTSPQTRRRRGA